MRLSPDEMIFWQHGFIKLNATILFTWIVMALLFRISSLSALTAMLLAPLVFWYLQPEMAYVYVTVIITVMLFWRHRTNIRDLISGQEGKIVRLQAHANKLPPDFVRGAREIGMASVTTTVHDDYFMFIKLNYKMPVSPTNRDEVAKAELELRQRQAKAIELFRTYVPGCEKAFIARTSPSLCVRRGRLIACDYDITLEDVLEGRHFDDDIMAYHLVALDRQQQPIGTARLLGSGQIADPIAVQAHRLTHPHANTTHTILPQIAPRSSKSMSLPMHSLCRSNCQQRIGARR